MTSVADSVRAAERALRECIRLVLSAEHGAGWFRATGLSDERVGQLEARRLEEKKRRPSVKPSASLLDYTELYELEAIITDAVLWQHFKPVFQDQKRFKVWMSYLLSYRNPAMHSRDLLPHEESLLHGISGEIRALVTKARTDRDADDEHFARIEGVRDSFGNVATEDERFVDTGLVLHPGDTVTLTCEGFDPTGAELQWSLHDQHGAQQLGELTRESTIEWTVEKRHITGGQFALSVFLVADRPYHRHGWHDGHVSFRYRVLPAP